MAGTPGSRRQRGALEDLARWASRVQLDDVPDRVTELAASQVLSHLAAIRTGLRCEPGRRIVRALGSPLQQDVTGSARVLAAAGAWLNLDDTAYAGHLGPSTVAVPVAYAYALGLSGADLLRSVIVSNECAARITASATLGPFRGQTALHTHLAGTVAGRLRSEDAPARVWENALALALSAPPWTLMRGFLGTDARLLHVPMAVRMGLDACDAAAAGLAGATDLIEHPDGFLAQFAAVPLPEAVTAGLGERWHTETLSFKLHPGGPGIDAAIDCAADLHRALPGLAPSDIREVRVHASRYTVRAAEMAALHMDGHRTPFGALVLTVPYPVATTLLTGRLTVDDFFAPAVEDPLRWALADKVSLHHDPSMTRQMFSGVAPFGEAVRQAGERARPWLAAFAGQDLLAGEAFPPPASSFSQATKPTPARVTVLLRDGRSCTRELAIPRGGAGPELRAGHRDLAAEKFIAAGGPPGVCDAWADLAGHGPRQLAHLIRQAIAPARPRHEEIPANA